MQYDLSSQTGTNLEITDELRDTRRKLAGILISASPVSEQRLPRISQLEIATALGVSWDAVNNSLISLKENGAIKIERHRISINQVILQRISISKE